MAEKDEKQKQEKEGEESWRYEHPKDHPDNKEPVTKVAEPTEEAAKKEEEMMNAQLEKNQKPSPEQQVAEKEKEAGLDRGAPKEKQDYEGWTVAELRDMAKDRGVEVPYDARKDEIIKALEKADRGK